jgi:hypothetical protein
MCVIVCILYCFVSNRECIWHNVKFQGKQQMVVYALGDTQELLRLYVKKMDPLFIQKLFFSFIQM